MLVKKHSVVAPENNRETTSLHNMAHKAPSENMDLEDRDPKNLSSHLQVSWEDVFGEPDSIRSPECAWSVSNQCFRITRNCCYICLSVLCAPFTAFCVGVTFACVSFQHIWCTTPCLRLWKISCGATKHFITACADAIIIPCTGACGYIFSEIKVKNQRLPEEFKQDNIHII